MPKRRKPACKGCAGGGKRLVRVGTSAAWVTCETCLGTGEPTDG